MVALLKMPSRLKLTPSSGDERRMFQRTDDRREVPARRLDHSVDARRLPNIMLSLRDLSVGGLGGTVDQPLHKGERLAVFFPPAMARPGFTAQGRIVRCEPSGLGYRIGVAFDAVPSAA
jgi:hypothetical protein